MRWITLRQLKALRKLAVPAEALENGRRRLLIVMTDAPMAAGRSRFHAFIWKPAVAVFVVVVFVAASGAGAVYASQGSLPGDRLYAVKLASEDLQEHLTISAERKFAVQAEHAARRLDETKALLERNGLDAKEREVRVRKAMDGYENRLTDMDAIAEKLVASKPSKRNKNKGKKAMQAIERVLDRHAALVDSATASDPDVAESVLAPIDGSIKLDEDVYAFTHRERSDDGEKTEDATDTERTWQLHRKERSDRLNEHLKRLRSGLRHEPLEIKAGM